MTFGEEWGWGASREASRIELGFPHEFLGQPNIRDLVYGGTWDRILDRRP